MRRCASYQAYKRNITVGRIRRLRRIRQPLPDATLCVLSGLQTGT
ncbi:hypothetical protein [Escherichia coli IS25]|nr:hypothetical protein [Escherichia coli IS25]